jgi:CBS domain-containing membrane protein
MNKKSDAGTWRDWVPRPAWKDWVPPPIEVSPREHWRVGLAAGLALVLIALFWRLLSWGLAWQGDRLGLLAPLGASALLVFAVPASPMAQPWPAVLGNTLSLAVGLLAVHALPWPELAIAAALPASILVMYATRSLHPPGTAMALLMVLMGPKSDPWVLITCGFVGSLLLVTCACFFNVWTGKRYPVRLPAH